MHRVLRVAWSAVSTRRHAWHQEGTEKRRRTIKKQFFTTVKWRTRFIAGAMYVCRVECPFCLCFSAWKSWSSHLLRLQVRAKQETREVERDKLKSAYLAWQQPHARAGNTSALHKHSPRAYRAVSSIQARSGRIRGRCSPDLGTTCAIAPHRQFANSCASSRYFRFLPLPLSLSLSLSLYSAAEGGPEPAKDCDKIDATQRGVALSSQQTSASEVSLLSLSLSHEQELPSVRTAFLRTAFFSPSQARDSRFFAWGGRSPVCSRARPEVAFALHPTQQVRRETTADGSCLHLHTASTSCTSACAPFDTSEVDM